MTLTVSKLARAADVGIETVRFYERRGLLEAPPRRPSGYRMYSHSAVTRIQFIRRAQKLGFTLNEIGELIEFDSRATGNCGDVRDRAVSKIAAVERKIADLVRMKAALETLLGKCDGTRPIKECPVMDCLQDVEA